MPFFSIYSRCCGTMLLRRNLRSLISRSFVKDSSKKFVLHLHEVYLKTVSLLGKEQACKLFQMLEPHVCQDDTPVMEMRAGEGFLTEMLLDAGARNLHVFEKRKTCLPNLEAIVSKCPERIKLHDRTFIEVLFEENLIPLYNSRYLEASLPFKCEKPWKDSPSMKIIAAHTNGKVLIVALIHLAKNMMHFGMGRPQFIITMPTAAWNKLIKDPKKANYQDYQTAGMLFPDFYEFEILGKMDPPIYYCSGAKSTQTAREEYLTVSIAPSKDLAEFASSELLEEYLFFATQTMNGKAKHGFVIPSIERWSPGSGRELVAQGVDCFTRYVDLTPREALRIFSIWRSQPNYSSSLFMHEFKRYLQYN